MRVLVTGGAGYIGSHVVLELCDKGYEVVVLDNLSSGNKSAVDKRAKFINGSTLNISDIELGLEKVEAVIHLAAFKAAGESMLDPIKYSQNNILGSINLLNAIIKHKINSFVFSSTAAVYGYPEYLPLDENHPLEPINYYGFTKLEIEKILQWYSELKGLKFAALRYFNAAGYDINGRLNFLEKNPANLIPTTMEVASGMRNKMHVFGNDYNTHDGTGLRDYIHVSDLAEAHLKALDFLNNNNNIKVNLSSGERHSVIDVIDMTKKISGKEINYEIVERRPGDPAELYASSDLAYDALHWKPKYSDLKTLIESTWDVYNK
ncbi:MAG: UDP-glucose 4-epimerase GalE [Candidatus Marinimicrobia bacterium]|nr:UDP-glucose 4-epimerase GalE [Candidatus Neomarinimicrobiota bacterium]